MERVGPDVARLIFEFLDPASLARSNRVSRYWRKAAGDQDCLWQKFLLLQQGERDNGFAPAARGARTKFAARAAAISDLARRRNTTLRVFDNAPLCTLSFALHVLTLLVIVYAQCFALWNAVAASATVVGHWPSPPNVSSETDGCIFEYRGVYLAVETAACEAIGRGRERTASDFTFYRNDDDPFLSRVSRQQAQSTLPVGGKTILFAAPSPLRFLPWLDAPFVFRHWELQLGWAGIQLAFAICHWSLLLFVGHLNKNIYRYKARSRTARRTRTYEEATGRWLFWLFDSANRTARTRFLHYAFLLTLHAIGTVAFLHYWFLYYLLAGALPQRFTWQAAVALPRSSCLAPGAGLFGVSNTLYDGLFSLQGMSFVMYFFLAGYALYFLFLMPDALAAFEVYAKAGALEVNFFARTPEISLWSPAGGSFPIVVRVRRREPGRLLRLLRWLFEDGVHVDPRRLKLCLYLQCFRSTEGESDARVCYRDIDSLTLIPATQLAEDLLFQHRFPEAGKTVEIDRLVAFIMNSGDRTPPTAPAGEADAVTTWVGHASLSAYSYPVPTQLVTEDQDALPRFGQPAFSWWLTLTTPITDGCRCEDKLQRPHAHDGVVAEVTVPVTLYGAS